ncbi:unnamed protein product [Orchesella dallaii]|uniref:Uncharacterized protein n=1 Tax=Orchesella dallaii TaxID=48710 RepID=A0ABP1QFZ3_9HEXA
MYSQRPRSKGVHKDGLNLGDYFIGTWKLNTVAFHIELYCPLLNKSTESLFVTTAKLGPILSYQRRQSAASRMESRPTSEQSSTEGYESDVPPVGQTVPKRTRNPPKRLIDEVSIPQKPRVYKKSKMSESPTTKRQTTSRPKIEAKPLSMSKVRVVVPETSQTGTERSIRNRKQVKHFPDEEEEKEIIFVADVPIRSMERAARRNLANMQPVVRLTRIDEAEETAKKDIPSSSSTASRKRIKINPSTAATNESNVATNEQPGTSGTAARKDTVEPCSSTSNIQTPSVNGQTTDDSLACRPTTSTKVRKPAATDLLKESATDLDDSTASGGSEKPCEMEKKETAKGKKKTSVSGSKAETQGANLDLEMTLAAPEANREVTNLQPIQPPSRSSTPLVPIPINPNVEGSDDETDDDAVLSATAATAMNDVPEENDDANANTVPAEAGQKNASTQTEPLLPPQPNGSTSNAGSEVVQNGASSLQDQAPLVSAFTEEQIRDMGIKLRCFTTYQMFKLLTIVDQHGQMPKGKGKYGVLHVNLLALDPPCLQKVTQFIDEICLNNGNDCENRASSSGNSRVGGQVNGEQSVRLEIRAPQPRYSNGVLNGDPHDEIAPQE